MSVVQPVALGQGRGLNAVPVAELNAVPVGTKPDPEAQISKGRKKLTPPDSPQHPPHTDYTETYNPMTSMWKSRTPSLDTGRPAAAMPAAFTCDQSKRRADTQDRAAHEAREKREKRRIEETEQKRIANALNITSETEYPSLGSTRVPTVAPALNYRAATRIESVATGVSSLFPVQLPPLSTAHAPQPRPAFTYSRAAYAGKEEDDYDPPEEEDEETGASSPMDELNADISGGRRWGGKNSLY